MERVLRTTVLLALIYLALVGQTTLTTVWGFPGVSWQWIPLVAYLALASCEPRTSLVLAGMAGLAADCISAGPLGLEAAACLMMSFVVQRWQLRRTLGQPAVAVWLLPLCLGCETALVVAARAWWGQYPLEPATLLLFAGSGAIATSILGLLLLRMFPRQIFAGAHGTV